MIGKSRMDGVDYTVFESCDLGFTIFNERGKKSFSVTGQKLGCEKRKYYRKEETLLYLR